MKDSNDGIVLVLFFVLVGVILMNMSEDISETAAEDFAAGMTVLSVSKINYMSSDPNLHKPVYAITFLQQGLGQSVEYTLKSDKIYDYATGQYKGQSDMKLEIDNTEQYCEYPISISSSLEPVYEVDYLTFPVWDIRSIESKKDDCRQKGVLLYYGGFDGITADTYCVYGIRKTSNMAEIKHCGDYSFNTLFRVTNLRDGGSVTGSLSSKSDRTISLGGSKALITLNGNLVSGETCRSPADDNVMAVYPDSTSLWQVGSKVYYENWREEFHALDRMSFATEDLLQDQMDRINNPIPMLLSQSTSTIGEYWKDTDVGTSIVRKQLSKQLQYPSFTAIIDAGWVGVYQPKPVPVIVSASSAKFKTGEKGYVTTTIRNTGDSGNIEVYAECGVPFNQVGTATIISLAKDDEQYVSIPIAANTDQPVSGTCNLKACSLGECVSRSVAVSCDPQATCEPEYVCDDNVWMKCNTYKTGRVEFMDCKADDKVCDLEDGEPVCVSELIDDDDDDSDDDGDSFLDKFFKGISKTINAIVPDMDDVKDVMYLVVGILVLVLMFVIITKNK